MGIWHILNLDGPDLKAYANSLPDFTEEEWALLNERYKEAMREFRAGLTSVDEAERNWAAYKREMRGAT